jgi:hypothetical protein
VLRSCLYCNFEFSKLTIKGEILSRRVIHRFQNAEELCLTFGMTSDDDNSNVLVEFHRIDGRGQVGNQVFAQRILTTQDKLLVICVTKKFVY